MLIHNTVVDTSSGFSASNCVETLSPSRYTGPTVFVPELHRILDVHLAFGDPG